MNQNNMDENLKEYLNKIKEKLPDWLKEDKEELNDVLSEIEEHVLDKAEELSDNGSSMESSIQQALADMGPPESIAKEYKRRGTPKVFVTEELWPLYTRVVGILCAVIIMLYVVFMIINTVMGSFQFDFIGMFFGLTSVFTLVTLIFVALSMEGYLPENLKTQEEREREKKKDGTGKAMKSFIKPPEMIIGGIIQMAIGLVFLIQPETGFTYLIDPEFLALMRISGVFIITEGGLNLIRGIIGNQQITNHQILIGIKVFLNIMSISILVILTRQPELVPFVPLDDVIISWIIAFIIFFVIIGAISDTFKAIALEKYRNKTEK